MVYDKWWRITFNCKSQSITSCGLGTANFCSIRKSDSKRASLEYSRWLRKTTVAKNNCCRPWKWRQNWEAIDQKIKCLLFAHPWWTQGWLQAHHRCIPGWFQVHHKFSSAGRLQVQVREGRILAEVDHNHWKEVLSQNPKNVNRNEITRNECFLW